MKFCFDFGKQLELDLNVFIHNLLPSLAMSRQDKATTEKFTKTLRELVKRPENKVCADCKRNGTNSGDGSSQ